MIVPFAPGGGLDLAARAVAQVLTEHFGQPVLVDNRPGAAGATGSMMVVRSAADGYTLLVGAATTHGINPVLQKLPYDPIADFEPVSLVATIPHILVVYPSLPVKTLPELIQYAKAKPGLAYGSVGVGSPHHLAIELINSSSGLDLVHVPYKGPAQAITDVMSGRLQFMSTALTGAMPQVKAGKLRALAIASARRVPGIDLPTYAEGGFPGIEVGSWSAVFAPAGTPRAVVDALSTAIARGLATSEVRDRLAAFDAIAIGSTPAELGLHVKAELARWSRAIKVAGIKVE